jgi:site-specific recombinase
MGALADMEIVGGLANAFYIVGIAGVIALGVLSLWVLFSPSFNKE